MSGDAAGMSRDPGSADLEARVRERVMRERKAFRIEELVERPRISEQELLALLPELTPDHYQEIVEERAVHVNEQVVRDRRVAGVSGTCGYLICDNTLNPLSLPKQQYRISLRHKRVYDVTDRRNYCSDACYEASLFLKRQISTTPLWLRKQGGAVTSPDEPSQYRLLNRCRGMPGMVVVPPPAEPTVTGADDDSDSAQSQDGDSADDDDVIAQKLIDQLRLETREQKLDGPVRTAGPVRNVKPPHDREIGSAVTSSKAGHDYSGDLRRQDKTALGTRGGVDVVITERSQDANDPGCPRQAGVTSREGRPCAPARVPEDPLSEVRDCLTQWVTPATGTYLTSDITEGGKVERPPFNTEQKQYLSEVAGFYGGKPVADELLTSSSAEAAGDSDVMPYVDSSSQMALRRKIVLERLQRPLTAALGSLNMTLGDVTPALRALLTTLHLSSDTISLRPAQWDLVCHVMLTSLGLRREPRLRALLHSDLTKRLLDKVKIEMADLESLAAIFLTT